MKYRDKLGRVFEVRYRYRISDGGSFLVAWRTLSGRLRRYNSPNCPLRQTQAEAQADLDAQAARHGWEVWP
jgi:hypothetical protein